MSNTSSSQPKDFLLHSFNAFDPVIAADPDQFINHLKRVAGAVPEADVTEQTSAQKFHREYKSASSSQEAHRTMAVSVGLSASFGFYSGSVKVATESEKYQKTTSFNSSTGITLDTGTVYYNNSDASSIRKLLKGDFMQRLDAIRSLQDAEAFTEQYGTHLVLGLKLGGALVIVTQATTSTLKERDDLNVDVEAAYNGVGSVEATASVTESLSKTSKASGFHQTIFTSGGRAAEAARINPKDGKTILNWADSCTDTVYGLSHSVTLAELADDAAAKKMLQRYYNLRVLVQSLKHPSIFSGYVPLGKYKTNTATATAPEGYKIISGGARATQGAGTHSVSSFLTGSYPSQSGTAINGWNATCHDHLEPVQAEETLTAYAIAVYDPADLLQVACTTGRGHNTGQGGDSAGAPLPAGTLLTGGGGRFEAGGGSELKFLVNCCSVGKDGTGGWVVSGQDHKDGARNVTLTAYAVGIHCDFLQLEAVRVTSPEVSGAQGNAHAELGGGLKIAGGGVIVDNRRQSAANAASGSDATVGFGGWGNLLQATFPSASNGWTEYNKDMQSPDPARSLVEAFGLKAAIKF